MKKIAFTLSEVLITLGLIGAVSALVMPTLAYNYRSKVLQEQFRSTYSDIRQIGAMINFEKGDVGTFANNSTFSTWQSYFMSHINGGNVYSDLGWPNVTTDKRKLYEDSGASPGPYRFNLSSAGQKLQTGDICDNGNIWHDSKGRIWTFNAESRIVCVDINGAANPNTFNIDTFAFIPMSGKQVAAYVYSDPENADNYSAEIVPCNLNMISYKGLSNSQAKKDDDGNYIVNHENPATALDACPFWAPVENVAEVNGCFKGKSAKNKTVTAKDSYWKTYIDYR